MTGTLYRLLTTIRDIAAGNGWTGLFLLSTRLRERL
jgi:hypothetical protein